jgi:DNA-binding transcriptional LysR family regulator
MAVNGQAGLLRVGFGITSLAAGLPEILTRFGERFPEVHVSMRDMSTQDQVEALEDGSIDVGFVRLPVERAELVSVPVLEEMLVAAIPRGMAYRGGLSGLHKEPFVVIPRSVSANLFDHLVQTCRAAGFSPRIVQEVGELLTVLNLVRAGIGVSLVPRSVSLMRVPGVRLMDTGLAEARWKIGLAWRKLDQSDPLVRNFVRLARQPREAAPAGPQRH